MSDEQDAVYETPRDFLTPMAGWDDYYCDGQSVLPDSEAGGYLATCSCGHWSVSAATMEDGLGLARAHTTGQAPKR